MKDQQKDHAGCAARIDGLWGRVLNYIFLENRELAKETSAIFRKMIELTRNGSACPFHPEEEQSVA